MATEIRDILAPSVVNERGGNVKSASRTFLITDLDATNYSSLDPAATIKEAFQALSVSQGALHPTYPYLFCKERIASIVDIDKVRFNLKYVARDSNEQQAPPADANAIQIGYVVSGRTYLESEETYKDKDGNDITIGPVTNGGGDLVGEKIGVPVSVDRPRRALVLERTIRTADPDAVAKALVGNVNDAIWQNEPIGTWRCDDVTFDQVNPGVSDGGDPEVFLPLYRMTFTFTNNPNGWDPDLVYTDPDTGKPVPDAQALTGATVDGVPLYEPVDFTALPL